MMDKVNMIGYLVGALAASTLAASPALANTQEVSVKYRPYELATTAGTAAVYDRISRQVKRACRGAGPVHLVVRKACRQELADSVVKQIGSAGLTAMHTGGKRVQLAAKD